MTGSRIRLIATAALVVAGIGLLALTLRGPGPAARLVSATPADGSRLGGAPHEVTLRFNGPVDAGQSHLEITAADGRPVADGPLDVRDDVLARPVRLAADAGYRIAYHAVLADGQQLAGEIVFGVGAASPPARSTGSAHDHTVDGNTPNLLLLGVDALLIGLAAVLILSGPRVRPDREPLGWRLPEQ
jgi:methionine-rich copper-binding protein CopC